MAHRRTIGLKGDRMRGETMSSEQTVKTERIEARIRPDLKALFERAADLLGVSLSHFLIESAATRAREVIQGQEVILLGKRDSQAFVEAILKPHTPNKALREAVEVYDSTVEH